MLKIGSHVSYSKEGLLGCVLDTIKYGGNSFMFYTGAPQNTIRKEIDLVKVLEAKKIMEENNISFENIIVHAPYIINLATSNIERRNFAINFLKNELDRCMEIGVKNFVLHPGNAVDTTRENGLDNIIYCLNQLNYENICITIETMAGKGTELCTNIDELAYVIKNLKIKNYGVTLDTCHLSDSGVNLEEFEKYLEEFEKKIGTKYIKCIHLNDSKNIIGSKKDRHENIGYGSIGFKNLLNIAYNEKLKNVPKILETPFIKLEKTSLPPYKEEIEMLKSKKFNKNLYEDIIKNAQI